MLPDEALASLRNDARAFETRLPIAQRKALGQFFTGAQASRLLAEIAVDEDTSRVLDPMAGTGDLLDAVWEAATHRGIGLRDLHAIEIHSDSAGICDRRLRLIARGEKTTPRVVCGDAFDVNTYATLSRQPYDLVIANPPYVRYQSLNGRGETTRRGLAQVLSRRLEGRARELWATLTSNYSGLADLSVPAWLLCALFVRPGGRLALVTPATWRSRDYAQVVRYLMLRAFNLEYVVEDAPPGWFPDALVGTHLVIARRLTDSQAAVSMSARHSWPSPQWTKIDPTAASPTSLVGAVFRGPFPEAAFARWCHRAGEDDHHAIRSRKFSVRDEWGSLQAQLRTADWLRDLEPDQDVTANSRRTSEPRNAHADAARRIPDRVRDLLPPDFAFDALRPMSDLGIQVGQGLRTGCNRFFYVQLVDQPSPEWSTITTSATFGHRVLTLPTAALRPVLHRQAQLDATGFVQASTHVLDLRLWALPEDLPTVNAAREVYRRAGIQPPHPMPHDLAHYVRDAARLPLDRPAGKPVPALSAVRTNARPAGHNAPPRFWYMLPDFMPRHRPNAFIPRIIHDAPRTYGNANPAILVDANFSTFWSDHPSSSPQLIATLLNSVWCRVLMEAAGTRLGGGALKLEASHLRRLPLPWLDRASFADLQVAAKTPTTSSQCDADRLVLRRLLPTHKTTADIDALAQALQSRELELRRFRQGVASP